MFVVFGRYRTTVKNGNRPVRAIVDDGQNIIGCRSAPMSAKSMASEQPALLRPTSKGVESRPHALANDERRGRGPKSRARASWRHRTRLRAGGLQSRAATRSNQTPRPPRAEPNLFPHWGTPREAQGCKAVESVAIAVGAKAGQSGEPCRPVLP